MRDVQHQLRDYWLRIADGLPVPTAELALTERIGEGAVRPLVDRPGPRSRPALAAAGRALLGRRRGEMTAASTTPQAAPRWRRPALAIGGAFAITLAAVGTVLLVTRGGQEAPPVTTVATTLPPTTTSPATTTTEGTLSVEEWSYPAEAVPPFHATIAWDRNPESTWHIGYQGSTALVEVWYEAPRRFRFQLIELDTDLVAQGVPGAGQHLGGPGSYIVGDGEAAGRYSFADGTWGEHEAYHYLAFMFWEPESSGGPFDWAGECAQHSELLGGGQVAGREARHISCSTVRGDWDLWVDAVTGLVLRMRGETEIDDSLLGSSPEGGFEVTAIEFGEAPILGGDTLFAVIAPEGTELPASIDVSAVPPLHAVIAHETDPDCEGPACEPSAYTQEIWYRDPENWRFEILAAEGPVEFGPGEIHTAADGVITYFYPVNWDGYANAYLVGGEIDWAPVAGFVPSEIEADWTQMGMETVAGRPAIHLARSDTYEGGSQTLDIWIDMEQGLLLKRVSAFTPVNEVRVSWTADTVLSIEINPAFPEGIFTFTPEPGWCNLDDMTNCTRGTWGGTNLSGGEEVPTFTGPLADGTPFDFADLRGRPVIVFFWWDAFGPGELEQWLGDFEALYQEWGDRVAFVSVPEMDHTDARRFVERVPLTHTVVACYDEDAMATANTNIVCTPDSPPYLWGVGWLYWVMIDADGRALDMLRGEEGTYEALNAMIAAAVGE